jgi:hypothetical protein
MNANSLRRSMKQPFAITMCVLVAGCVSAQVTRLVQTVYPPIATAEVTVLADISELMVDTIRYERLAVINMSGDSDGFTDQADMLNKAREEAAKIGANAIIMGGYAQGNTFSSNEGSAIAIRYEIVRAANIPGRP